MQPFLFSCDWGTSSFRLRLIDTTHTSTIAVYETGEGIKTTFQLWQQTKEDRVAFFLKVLKRGINDIEKKQGASLEGTTVILSGMATSSIGLKELPYKELPFLADGTELLTERLAPSAAFPYPIIMISGARSETDVMRGEETQLTGCISHEQPQDGMYILPGTHSKHVYVRDGKVTDFKTYMTGEVFELLSTKSILANSIERNDSLHHERHHAAFCQGAIKGSQQNLLHGSFLVRTNQLFNKYSKEENYFYLSGLVIGTELKEALHHSAQPLIFIGNQSLLQLYTTALEAINSEMRYSVMDADEAIVKGHLFICQRHA